MTFGEVILWNELKDDKFWGFDFNRQRCIDNYIVDFYAKNSCWQLKWMTCLTILKKYF